MTTFQDLPPQSRRAVRQSERDGDTSSQVVSGSLPTAQPFLPATDPQQPAPQQPAAPPATGRRSRAAAPSGLVDMPTTPPTGVAPEPLTYTTQATPGYQQPAQAPQQQNTQSTAEQQAYRVRDFSPEGRRSAQAAPQQPTAAPLDYRTQAGPPPQPQQPVPGQPGPEQSVPGQPVPQQPEPGQPVLQPSQSEQAQPAQPQAWPQQSPAASVPPVAPTQTASVTPVAPTQAASVPSVAPTQTAPPVAAQAPLTSTAPPVASAAPASPTATTPPGSFASPAQTTPPTSRRAAAAPQQTSPDLPTQTLSRRELRALQAEQDAASALSSGTFEVPPLVEPVAAPPSNLSNAMAEFEALTRASQAAQQNSSPTQQSHADLLGAARAEQARIEQAERARAEQAERDSAQQAYAEQPRSEQPRSEQPRTEQPRTEQPGADHVPADQTRAEAEGRARREQEERAHAEAEARAQRVTQAEAAQLAQAHAARAHAEAAQAAQQHAAQQAEQQQAEQQRAREAALAAQATAQAEANARALAESQQQAEILARREWDAQQAASQQAAAQQAAAQQGAAAPAQQANPFDALLGGPSATSATNPPASDPLTALFVEPSIEQTGSHATSTGHWSQQAQLEEEEQPFENTLSRDVGGGNVATTTSALVLPVMPTADFGGIISGTGEILVTGSIELPRSLGTTGGDSRRYDDPDVDNLFDAFDNEIISTDSAPVRAIRAVSTHTSTHGVITTANKPHGNRLLLAALIAIPVLIVGIAGLLIAAFSSGMF